MKIGRNYREKAMFLASLFVLASVGCAMEPSPTSSDQNPEMPLTGTTVNIDWQTKLSPSDITNIFDSNPNMTKLSLFCNGLNEEAVRLLFEGLKTNTTLITLGLYQNGVGCDKVLDFAQSHEQNTTLKSLGLTTNFYSPLEGDQVARAFANMLLKNSTLTTLNLSQNEIGPDGFKDLAQALEVNTTLSTLILNHNSFAKKDYKYSQIGADAFSIMLQKNTTLKKLDLSSSLCCHGFALSGASVPLIKALENNTTLTFLNLDEWHIDPIDNLIHLLEVNKVITLKLGACRMRGEAEFKKWGDRVEFIEG